MHLASWPRKTSSFSLFLGTTKSFENYERGEILLLGLEARQKAGIKVRRPINKIEIVADGLSNDYIEIIKDELKYKNVVYTLKIKLGITKIKS